MTRRAAIILGVAVAVLAAGEIVGLSAYLSADRAADRERYERAVASQRREAGKPVPRPAAAPTVGEVETMCITGVDTFSVALDRRSGRSLLDEKARLDVARLAQLSDRATRAERYVEAAVAGPALPQRLGRERVIGDDGSVVWQSHRPRTVECDGTDAFARVRLPPLPVVPEPTVEPTLEPAGSR